MLKKSITYEDYNGVQRTDNFFFNLNKAEITEMNLSVDGGLVNMINKIVEDEDGKQIVSVLKEFILKSYGEKSADGKRFIKVDVDGHALANDFAQTEAYSQLFMELAYDADAAAAFFNAVIPQPESNVVPMTAPSAN